LRAPGPAFHAGFFGDSAVVVAFPFPLPFDGSGLGVFGFGLGVLSFGLELLSFFGLGLLPPFPSPFGLGLLEGDFLSPFGLGLLFPFEPELLELELLDLEVDLEGDFGFDGPALGLLGGDFPFSPPIGFGVRDLPRGSAASLRVVIGSGCFPLGYGPELSDLLPGPAFHAGLTRDGLRALATLNDLSPRP
jgi:hypothetical protein